MLAFRTATNGTFKSDCFAFRIRRLLGRRPSHLRSKWRGGVILMLHLFDLRVAIDSSVRDANESWETQPFRRTSSSPSCARRLYREVDSRDDASVANPLYREIDNHDGASIASRRHRARQTFVARARNLRSSRLRQLHRSERWSSRHWRPNGRPARQPMTRPGSI